MTATSTGKAAGGVNFPDEDSPDYLDFAYFSFVIGMTSQVSDVTISARGHAPAGPPARPDQFRL